ncbi:SLC26A6 isoform 16, partial [Pongo abelii]
GGLHAQCPGWPLPGGAGPDPLRLRGHLPVRASCPRLYHSCSCAGLRLTAQVCVWPPSEQPLWATVPHLLLEVCRKLPQSKVGTVVTAAVAGVVLVVVKLLNDKLQQQLPIPIPGELLTLIGATGISYGMGLKHRFEAGAPSGPQHSAVLKARGQRLHHRCGWVRHCHLAGEDLRPEARLPGGQQPGAGGPGPQ